MKSVSGNDGSYSLLVSFALGTNPDMLQDLCGGDPKALAQVMRGLIVAANQDLRLRGVFSTFSATSSSIFLDFDRDKVQVLGVSLGSAAPTSTI
jgi:multidrug efflux pump subunit AcrB